MGRDETAPPRQHHPGTRGVIGLVSAHSAISSRRANHTPGFCFTQVMKAMAGKGNPALVNEALKRALS